MCSLVGVSSHGAQCKITLGGQRVGQGTIGGSKPSSHDSTDRYLATPRGGLLMTPMTFPTQRQGHPLGPQPVVDQTYFKAGPYRLGPRVESSHMITRSAMLPAIGMSEIR